MPEFHLVTVNLYTDDGQKLNEILRLVLGLQGILSPDVVLSYKVTRSDLLDHLEDQRDQDKDELPF